MISGEELAHRSRLADIVYDFAAALDGRDWDGLIAMFTDEVTFDYASHSGNPACVTTPQAWFGRMRDARPGFDATQHSLANLRFRIGASAASVQAYVRAEHFLAAGGTEHQATLGGTYDFDFVRKDGDWRISAMRLNVTWKTGDNALYELAFAGEGESE